MTSSKAPKKSLKSVKQTAVNSRSLSLLKPAAGMIVRLYM